MTVCVVPHLAEYLLSLQAIFLYLDSSIFYCLGILSTYLTNQPLIILSNRVRLTLFEPQSTCTINMHISFAQRLCQKPSLFPLS